MIQKALEEGELWCCITGLDGYYIHSRDERFQNLTDYVLLLWNFDWYYAKHPDSNLKGIYESALEEMLCSEKPADIYRITVCTHLY